MSEYANIDEDIIVSVINDDLASLKLTKEPPSQCRSQDLWCDMGQWNQR